MPEKKNRGLSLSGYRCFAKYRYGWTYIMSACCFVLVVFCVAAHLTTTNKRKFTLGKDDCFVTMNMSMDALSDSSFAARFPAVFTYFTSGPIKPDSYIWISLRQSLRHHRDSVLISNASSVSVPTSLQGRISLVDMAPLVASAQGFDAFHRVYQPWGMREPWEEENFLRFFVLSAYMEREGLEYVFFADTDVALNGPIPTPPLRHCDAMVMYRDRDAPFSDLFSWEVWAGTSILSRAVLAEFIAFTPQMYVEPYLTILREKNERSPYVCDMTLWYFYVAAADALLREKWGVTVNLPPTPPRRFCSSAKFGFNNMIGDLDNGKQCPPPIRSIHFQGDSKDWMRSYQHFATGIYDGAEYLH